jgi:hypothetical protein
MASCGFGGARNATVDAQLGTQVCKVMVGIMLNRGLGSPVCSKYACYDPVPMNSTPTGPIPGHSGRLSWTDGNIPGAFYVYLPW